MVGLLLLTPDAGSHQPSLHHLISHSPACISQDISAIKGEDAGTSSQWGAAAREKGFPVSEEDFILVGMVLKNGVSALPDTATLQPPGRGCSIVTAMWMDRGVGCSAPLRAYGLLRRGQGTQMYPEVDDGHSSAVGPAHNAVEVLQAGGEEGAEGASQPDLPGLLEALEISSSDATHAAAQRGI